MPFVRAVLSSSLPAGTAKRVLAGGGMVAVFRLKDGSLRAIDAPCPHQEGALSMGVVTEAADDPACGDCPKVTCPLHQLEISLTDGRIVGGAADIRAETHAAGVRSYATEERGGWVWVDVPAA